MWFHFASEGEELFSAYSTSTGYPDGNFVGIRGRVNGSRCCTGPRCLRSKEYCNLTFHFRSGLNLDWSSNFLAVAAAAVVVAAAVVAFEGCCGDSH